MDPIAKVLSERGDTLAEVAELLYGDGAWEFVSKKSAQQEKNERLQARIGLGTNVLGIGAGVAGTKVAWRDLQAARDEKRGIVRAAKAPGRIASLKPIRSTAELISRHPVGVAGAGLALQVGNVAGDAVANRVLARSAKKNVHKGMYRDAKNTLRNTERASAAAADGVEQLQRSIPSKKQAAVLTGTTIGALGASQYAATYYGTKHGARAAQRPKRKLPKFTKVQSNGTVQKNFDWNSTFEISKVDADKRQVFGWASVITMDGKPVVDLQDDYMAMETIEKAAYDYVKSSRKGGDMHRRNGAEPHHVSDMIESFVVTDEKKEKLGLPADFPTGWLVGFQVNDDDTWKLVKDGKRTQFSIHGSGQRVEKVLD